MKKRVASVFLFLFAVLSFGTDVFAITVSLSANPPSFTGNCPAVITFKGQITSSSPGRVQYKFIRSDNANAPVHTLHFETAGTKAVSTTWTLGGSALPVYTGWQAIQIVYPQQIQSNRAEFSIRCATQDNQDARKPDLGICGFLKIGRQQREVRWNRSITLTPADATLVSGGTPAFEIYYDYREYNGVAVSGPFRNKIFFNDTLVSQQSNLSCGSMEIKNVHTQAYLGPHDGKLQINIDSDNDVAESQENNNFHFNVNIRFQGFSQSEAGNHSGSISEDCISFNPDTAAVQHISNGWKIVDGSHSMFSFGSRKAEADKALSIIKHYRMNRTCFVGRPDPSFTYMKVSEDAPAGGFDGEDCVSFNPQTIEVRQISGDWKIVDGGHWVFSFGSKRAEARQAFAIIKKYSFNNACFVGRPNPSFRYLRK